MTTGSSGEVMLDIVPRPTDELSGVVIMHTEFGGTRMIDVLVGDPLPRIC